MKNPIVKYSIFVISLAFILFFSKPDHVLATCYTAPDPYYQTCLSGVGTDPNYRLCPNPPPTCCTETTDSCPGTTTPTPVVTPTPVPPTTPPAGVTDCYEVTGGSCVPGNYTCNTNYGQMNCGVGNFCGVNCSAPTNDCDLLGGTCQAVATGCGGQQYGSNQCQTTKDAGGNPYICCAAGSGGSASANPCPGGFATCLPGATSANRDKFSDSRKVNEYVSWYLNGTIGRAEYPPLNMYRPEDILKITSFSGPLNKRLPLAYVDLMKINAINNASLINETTLLPEQHNQIVVCASKILGLFGPAIPHECYPNPGGSAKGSIYRLKDWEGDLSAFAGAANWLLGTDVWNSRKPPLPWGNDQKGNPMTEATYRKYYNEWRGNTCVLLPVIDSLFCFDNPLVTNEYADLFPYIPLANTTDKNALHIVSGIQMQPNAGTVACFSGDTDSCSNPVPPDEQPDPPANNGQLDGDNPDIVHEPVLYYAHTLEDLQLSDMLNKVFTPTDCHLDPENLSAGCQDYVYPEAAPKPRDYENLGCAIVDTRSNPGDNLFQGSQDSRIDDLAVYVDIQIEKIGCSNSGTIDSWIADCGCDYPNDCPTRHGCELEGCDLYDPIYNPTGACAVCGPYPNKCSSYPNCPGSISLKIPSTPKIPYAEEIWKSTVVNKESTFRRIFPKIEEGAPVSCIADITGTTSTQYVPLPDPGYTPLVSIETPLATNIPHGAYGVTSSELYFPWQGTIYEYFLRGIQTAIRPKGYGNPIPNGTECNVICGELPDFGNTGDCNLKSTNVNGIQIPPNLAKILEAAGFAYDVPPSLIVGVLYGEGAFNQPPGNATGRGYDWTDDNVLNWASCDGLPSCTDPTTTIVGFIPGGFEASVQAYHVLDKLKEFDPTVTEVDPCNLWHVIFVISAMLRSGAGGNPGAGGISGQSCYGITMGSYIPQNCSEWYQGSRGDSMMETAIRAWEYGVWYDPTSHASLTCPVAGACNCATKLGGCAAGGFEGSACTVPGDSCEKKSGSSSHNGCVWNVAHGN